MFVRVCMCIFVHKNPLSMALCMYMNDLMASHTAREVKTYSAFSNIDIQICDIFYSKTCFFSFVLKLIHNLLLKISILEPFVSNVKNDYFYNMDNVNTGNVSLTHSIYYGFITLQFYSF